VHLEDIIRGIRSYRGVTRKAPIGEVADMLLPGSSRSVLAAAGEDAAAISCGEEVLLLAADGIVEDLIAANPRWAGYCSVLVNVNDIAAMGGLPVAAVNVMACSDPAARKKITLGMRAACDKFDVPMVGGHLHPDAAATSVSVAMLGRTTPQRLVLSSGARTGDSVVIAMDLRGRFSRGVPYSWDTTSWKSSADVRRRVSAMNRIGHMVTAGKDISNPGTLGSLGMLLEASRRGASVGVDSIPRPARIDVLRWLVAYQGCGFVVTCSPRRVAGVLRELEKSGLTSRECGYVTNTNTLELSYRGQSGILFDFRRDRLGCRVPQKI